MKGPQVVSHPDSALPKPVPVRNVQQREHPPRTAMFPPHYAPCARHRKFGVDRDLGCVSQSMLLQTARFHPDLTKPCALSQSFKANL